MICMVNKKKWESGKLGQDYVGRKVDRTLRNPIAFREKSRK